MFQTLSVYVGCSTVELELAIVDILDDTMNVFLQSLYSASETIHRYGRAFKFVY